MKGAFAGRGESVVLADEYSVIAALCAEMGNRDQALDAFERMCEHALDFETGNGKHTSPAFRGLDLGGWVSDEYSYCRDELIPLITHDPSFDPLREEPRYMEVVEKLRNARKK